MDPYSPKSYFIAYVLVTVLAVLNIVLVFTWASEYLGGFSGTKDPLHHFNYHPVLSVIGFIVLYGKGLLIYRTMRQKAKLFLKLLHAFIFIAVFICAVISLKTVFDSHDKRPIPVPNMYSLHSWIGLGTVVLFSIQLLYGFITFLYPGLNSVHRRFYMPYHKFFGTAIFGLAVLSCHSGIMEKVKASLGKSYLELPPAGFVANFLGVSVTVYALLVIFLVTMPQFQRKPLPEERVQLELHDVIP